MDHLSQALKAPSNRAFQETTQQVNMNPHAGGLKDYLSSSKPVSDSLRINAARTRCRTRGWENYGVHMDAALHFQKKVLHADYTASQLKAFRQYSINEQTGSTDVYRVNAMMNSVAKGLTNEEIDALAQYIAGLH